MGDGREEGRRLCRGGRLRSVIEGFVCSGAALVPPSWSLGQDSHLGEWPPSLGILPYMLKSLWCFFYGRRSYLFGFLKNIPAAV